MTQSRWLALAVVPTLALAATLAAPMSLLAQTGAWAWSETVVWQYGQEPLPQTAVGVAIGARVATQRFVDLRLDFGVMPIMGKERQLARCASPAGSCDDRQIGPYATTSLLAVAGLPSRRLFALFGFGAYASRWGTGGGSGTPPRGGLGELGFGSRLGRALLETRTRVFSNTNYAGATALTFAVGFVQ